MGPLTGRESRVPPRGSPSRPGLAVALAPSLPFPRTRPPSIGYAPLLLSGRGHRSCITVSRSAPCRTRLTPVSGQRLGGTRNFLVPRTDNGSCLKLCSIRFIRAAPLAHGGGPAARRPRCARCRARAGHETTPATARGCVERGWVSWLQSSTTFLPPSTSASAAGKPPAPANAGSAARDGNAPTNSDSGRRSAGGPSPKSHRQPVTSR